MYPFIHIGTFELGTFGLLVWLAAVFAGFLLHLTFERDGVDADAMNVVVFVLLAGIVGSKLWHELQSPAELRMTLHQIFLPGRAHPGQVLSGLLEWLRAGFAWFGGLLAGIAMLLWQGKLTRPNGLTGFRAGIRMLDLAAPAAAVGYGVGRIGCLLSGDGDYGRNTTSTLFGHSLGVHMAKNALVRPFPATAAVLPTPLWEFAAALLIAWILWRFGRTARPLGWLTGFYLVLSGTARFLVEFYRINPLLYFHHTMSNAQVAAAVSAILGAVLMLAVRRNPPVGGAALSIARPSQEALQTASSTT
jgi:phosphatidylglycerol:prolipoprotein diacylglycerol transferase